MQLAHTLLITWLALAVPTASFAQPASADPKADAAAFYREGAALFKGGKYKEAAVFFQKAYALDQSPILLYNLARASEEMGDAVGAIKHYRHYVTLFPESRDRAEVERRIRTLDAIQRRLNQGRVLFSNVPADSVVTLNGEPKRLPDDASWRLDPGTYTVRIAPAVGREWRREFTLEKGQRLELAYAAKVDEAGGLSAIEWAGWGSLGGGAVMLGVGGLFYAQAFSARDDYDAARDRIANGDTSASALARKNEAEDAVGSNTNIARVFWGLGAAAVGAGVYLLVFEQDSETGGEAAVMWVPGGVGLTGTF